MTTTDPFTEAARAEAERRWPRLPHDPSGHYLNMGKRVGFDLGAQWAAAQEPTDAECVAVLNVKYGGYVGPHDEPHSEEDMAEARAALSVARAARRDEEKR